MKQLAVSQLQIIKRNKSTATTNMKKVKLDHRYTDNHRGKQRSRSIAAFLSTMIKLENITILVLIVLAHQIHGIHSQGKKPFQYYWPRKCRRQIETVFVIKKNNNKLSHFVGLHWKCEMPTFVVWLLISQPERICWHILQWAESCRFINSNQHIRITQWTTCRFLAHDFVNETTPSTQAQKKNLLVQSLHLILNAKLPLHIHFVSDSARHVVRFKCLFDAQAHACVARRCTQQPMVSPISF